MGDGCDEWKKERESTDPLTRDQRGEGGGGGEKVSHRKSAVTSRLTHVHTHTPFSVAHKTKFYSIDNNLQLIKKYLF